MRVATFSAGLLVAALSAGCGASRADRVREAEKSERAEHAPDKLLARGKLFATTGDYTRASQYLTAALEAGANPDEVLPVLMRVYVVSGRFRLAIQTGEQQLTKTPEAHALRYLVGTLYAAIGRSDRAREHLERVVGAQPKHAEAHYALGVVLRDAENDPIGADEQFREYLELEPRGRHAEEARDSLLKELP